MKKIKNYTFFVGLIGAVLSVVSFVLDFFGVMDIMPIIVEIVAVISAVLVSVGVVQKDTKAQDIIAEKDEIKDDITDNINKQYKENKDGNIDSQDQ